MLHVVRVIRVDGKLVADSYCSVCGVRLDTRLGIKRNLFCKGGDPNLAKNDFKRSIINQ